MNPRTLRRKILQWYDRQGRDLPWRRTRDPYHIFVSEYMLQQTQVARVLTIYPRWLKTFPSFRRLAAAGYRETIIAWSGMGYNRRALYLKRAAEMIVKEFSGKLPEDRESLRSLPGVGEYTASALSCFVHGRRVPVIDVNVRRVISRIAAVGIPAGTRRGGGTRGGVTTRGGARARRGAPVESIAGLLLPKSRFYDWNQALMDLGALICTARNPRCDICPVRIECASRERIRVSVRANRTGAETREIPRRIHRGRVIELLRNNSRGVPFAAIGLHLFSPFTPSDEARLLDILASLEKDALLRARAGGRSVSAEKWENMRHLLRFDLAR